MSFHSETKGLLQSRSFYRLYMFTSLLVQQLNGYCKTCESEKCLLLPSLSLPCSPFLKPCVPFPKTMCLHWIKNKLKHLRAFRCNALIGTHLDALSRMHLDRKVVCSHMRPATGALFLLTKTHDQEHNKSTDELPWLLTALLKSRQGTIGSLLVRF